MLKVHVQSQAVRRNIDLFKQIAKKVSQKSFHGRAKSYTALVNRITGAMRFSEMKGLDSREWKQIVIHIDLDRRDLRVFKEGSQKEEAFEYKDLEPTAYRIMTETLTVLQGAAHKINALEELGQLEVELFLALPMNSDLIHEAWHQLDRAEAESLLQQYSPGAYFFRKDSYAKILENELENVHQKPVKCLTLTFLDPQGVIRDLTVISYEHRWVFYDGDPNLKGASFESIEDLLSSMGDLLKEPLLA